MVSTCFNFFYILYIDMTLLTLSLNHAVLDCWPAGAVAVQLDIVQSIYGGKGGLPETNCNKSLWVSDEKKM